jgi:hypothetical protein
LLIYLLFPPSLDKDPVPPDQPLIFLVTNSFQTINHINMDFLKKAASQMGQESSGTQEGNQQPGQSSGSEQNQEGGLGGLLGGLKDKANSAAGGGAEGEKNEDYLDK